MLRDDDLGAAIVQLGKDCVAIEGFVGDPRVKLDDVEANEMPSASESARIFAVMPPFEWPMV